MGEYDKITINNIYDTYELLIMDISCSLLHNFYSR